jgi:hypothetical protein
MIGLVPVVRNRLFDMVSNGKTFALSIPPQNKFIVGSNEINKPSPAALENLRPQAIFDALLLKEIDPENEIALFEQSTETVKDRKTHKDVEQADYEVIVSRKHGKNWYLSRKIIFSRVDLLPHRQFIYNLQAQLVTDAQYDKFANYAGTMLPTSIQIDRPLEGNSIQLTITKASVNQELGDEQFVLTQPPGSQLVDMDRERSTTALNEQRPQEAPKPSH